MLAIKREEKAATLKIDAKTKDGDTPLMIAAFKGYHEIVGLLLAAGADKNSKNIKDWTALLGTAHYGYHEVIKVLLAAGADVTSRRADGKKLIDLALEGLRSIKTAADTKVPPLAPEQILERTKGMRKLIALLVTNYPGAI